MTQPGIDTPNQGRIDDFNTIAAVRRFIRTGEPIRWLGTLDELREVNRRNAMEYLLSEKHLIADAEIVRAFETRDSYVPPPLVDEPATYVQRNGGVVPIDLIDEAGAHCTTDGPGRWTWQRDGRFLRMGESLFDLVEKLTPNEGESMKTGLLDWYREDDAVFVASSALGDDGVRFQWRITIDAEAFGKFTLAESDGELCAPKDATFSTFAHAAQRAEALEHGIRGSEPPTEDALIAGDLALQANAFAKQAASDEYLGDD